MKKEKKNTNPYHICDDNIMATNACTECTGLMPTPTENAEEWETYQDIFHFTPEPDTSENKEKEDSPARR